MIDKLTNKPESSQKVRDLLRGLQESQLVQIEKMIALGELSAEVVHDMRQPLNGIMLTCQLMQRDIEKDRLDQEELEKNIAEIKKTAESSLEEWRRV